MPNNILLYPPANFGGGGGGGPTTDIYGPTRIVSNVASEGTDTTIASALTALSTTGGNIQIKPGTYSFAVTNTMPDHSIVIRGSGDDTILNLGLNAISAFTIPNGLTAERTYTFEDFKIAATVALPIPIDAHGWSVQDSSSRGVLNINRVNTSEIKSPFQVTAGSDPVIINASDCHFQQLADNSSILIVNSPSFPVVNLTLDNVRFYRNFEDAVVGSISQGGYFINFTNVNVIGKDSYFAHGTVDCMVGAFNVVGCTFYNGAPTANTRISIADDNFAAIESAVEGSQITFVDFEMAGNGTRFIGCTMDSSSFRDGAVSFFGDCYFIGGPGANPSAEVIFGVNDTTVNGCRFDNIGTASSMIVSPKVVTGCTFANTAAPVATIDLPNGSAIIDGNFFAAGIPIRETISANNTITGNTFAGSPPTMLATGTSLLNNGNIRTITTTPVTLTERHRTVNVDATLGVRVINLPTAVSATFRIYTIKKIDASVNTVTITPSGAETIDGVTPVTLLTQWASITIQSDGTAWFKISLV